MEDERVTIPGNARARLRAAREARGLRQFEIEGIHRNTISAIERRGRALRSYVKKYAEFLGVDVGSLEISSSRVGVIEERAARLETLFTDIDAALERTDLTTDEREILEMSRATNLNLQQRLLLASIIIKRLAARADGPLDASTE